MKNDDLLYVLPSTSISVFASLTKSIQYPLFESRDTVLRSYSEGLYHITSDEAADKIIESQELHASGRFRSYDIHKRCFFFGGVPDFENVCLNVTPGVTLTAVRVMLPYEELAKFDYRGMNDGAITCKGDLSLANAKVEKVRLGLKERDGELYYAPISEEEYQDYKPNISEEKQSIVNNKLAFKLRGYVSGLRREFELFMQNMGKLAHDVIHDEKSGFIIDKRAHYVDKNSDLFEHTDEIPIVEISEHEQAINMFNSLMDENNQTYQMGNAVFNSKDDVKAQLLKSVVSSVVTSIQEGSFVPSSDGIIRPGMSDKDISSVLYSNICSGKIEECYHLLDNPTILFSACKNFIQNSNRTSVIDPRIDFLHKDIDNFNSNLKENSIGQASF